CYCHQQRSHISWSPQSRIANKKQPIYRLRFAAGHCHLYRFKLAFESTIQPIRRFPGQGAPVAG
ncbi:MAG: hypothetical protein ACR2QU_10575, partial [Gammaproteobacteria bacterium]